MSEKVKKKSDLDAILKECSTCGNCLHSCPVYRCELTEPDSPRGKLNLIKALEDKRLDVEHVNKDFLYHCVLCGSCEYICPKGVDFKSLMIKYRNKLTASKKIPFLKKLILTFYNKSFLHFFRFFINLLHKTFLAKKFFIPKVIKRKLNIQADPAKTYDILVFPGCGLDIFNQDVLEKIVKFFTSSGYSVVIPDKLVCCGFPSLSHGFEKKFNRLRAKNKKIISGYNFNSILIPCGTGVYTFNNYYKLDTKIYELTEFIYKFIKNAGIKEEYLKGKQKTSYHDPCHNLKSLNIKEEPRFFLRQLKGNFIDNKNETCCGFGGLFSMFFQKTSKKILKNKEDEFDGMKVEQVMTSCPGCYMHFKENSKINIKHFIELFELDKKKIR